MCCMKNVPNQTKIYQELILNQQTRHQSLSEEVGLWDYLDEHGFDINEESRSFSSRDLRSKTLSR